MPAVVEAIDYVLPERTESVEDLVACFPHWTPETVIQKTGIRSRHLASKDECASDLGVAAAQRLLSHTATAVGDIDYLIFCTQTPDYLVPTTACLVQERLGLGRHVGALDINLGCSGYIYGLGIAKALLETGQASQLLLITADTYSKFVHPGDRGVRALFGDAGAATLVSVHDSEEQERIGPFVYGTDGRGAYDLIVPASAMRKPPADHPAEEYTDSRGNTRSDQNIYMHGRAVVEFTRREVPAAIWALCDKAGISLADVDVVVPHQASTLVLEGLQHTLDLPPERFIIGMEDIGNTISCSVPIALKRGVDTGKIRPGTLLLLVGFGVGLSWGATLIRLPQDFAV